MPERQRQSLALRPRPCHEDKVARTDRKDRFSRHKSAALLASKPQPFVNAKKIAKAQNMQRRCGQTFDLASRARSHHIGPGAETDLASYCKTSKPISRRISNWYSLLRPMAGALVTNSNTCNRFSTALDRRIAACEDGDRSGCDTPRFIVSIKPASVPLRYRIVGMVRTNVALGLGDSVLRHVSQSRQPSPGAMSSCITRSVPRCTRYDDNEGHSYRSRLACSMAGA